jgi:hypothetical protein
VNRESRPLLTLCQRWAIRGYQGRWAGRISTYFFDVKSSTIKAVGGSVGTFECYETLPGFLELLPSFVNPRLVSLKAGLFSE